MNDMKKEINNRLSKYIKQEIKQYGFRKVSNTVYKHEGDFFIHSVFFIKYIEDFPYIAIRNYIKPYYYDDLFWTIIGMKENSNSRDSLRAIGAFSSPSFKISEHSFQLSNIEELHITCATICEGIEKTYCSYMEEIQFSVENFNEQMLIKQGYLREYLIKILACIQLSSYQEALNIVEQEIQKGERGGFSNNGKDILFTRYRLYK